MANPSLRCRASWWTKRSRETRPHLNATQAAKRAGYSEKTANEQGARLLANVSVQAAIQEAMDARIERTEITADYILETIRDTVERCRSIKLVTDRKGNVITINTEDGQRAALCQFDPFAVIKGCELLGKHLKLFTDRIEHTRIIRGLRDLTDEELDAILADDAAGDTAGNGARGKEPARNR